MAPHSGHTAGEGSHAYTRRAALTLASRAAAGAGALALSGCASTVNASSDRMHVVATTPILADLAQQIAGDRASVHSLVPAGADPHSYEPSLRDIRDVAYARCALTSQELANAQKAAAAGKLPNTGVVIDPFMVSTSILALALGAMILRSARRKGRSGDTA